MLKTDRDTIEALSEALEDEYKARALYRKVIERFGAARPFVNIVDSEQRHVEALLRQFDRLGEAPPADAWPMRLAAPESLARACAEAVEAEIQNDVMYARLLRSVSDAQAREVMLRLQEASRSQHLPAFRRCLESETRGGGRGPGCGRAS
jgi:rubrerythrin